MSEELLKEIDRKVSLLLSEFKKLSEVNTRLIHQQLNAPVPASVSSPVDPGLLKNSIYITKLGIDRIKVQGKSTFKLKDTLKGLNGSKWEQELKAWSYPLDNLAQVIEAVENEGIKDIGVDVDETDVVLKKGFVDDD